MRVLVSVDMEGATGVTWSDDCLPGTAAWQRMRRLLTGDVNAAVAGLCAGGASEVVVNEAHLSQRNVLLEDLDPRAVLLTGRHKPLAMMEGIDHAAAPPDGVVLLGYHAMSGQQGVLSHTWLPRGIVEVRLDGVPAGEGALNTALAAEHGVPVLLVTGDDLTCAEAATYAPTARTVAVKRCVSRYAAICLPPARTAAMITEAATAAMADAGRGERAPGPHRIEIEFDAAHAADAAAVVPTVEQLDVRTVGFTASTMTAAMCAFKIVCSAASGASEGEYG